jgi:hypothetical protein
MCVLYFFKARLLVKENGIVLFCVSVPSRHIEGRARELQRNGRSEAKEDLDSYVNHSHSQFSAAISTSSLCE